MCISTIMIRGFVVFFFLKTLLRSKNEFATSFYQHGVI